MEISIKCKLCRQIILGGKDSSAFLINAHGINTKNHRESANCSSIVEETHLFFNDEQLPDWMLSKVVAEQWSKGKLNCPHCNARIGAFDFVSGIKCACENYILPAVYIINSKVDIEQR